MGSTVIEIDDESVENLGRDEVKKELYAAMRDSQGSITFLRPQETPLVGTVIVTIQEASKIRQLPQEGNMISTFFKYQDPYVRIKPQWGENEQSTAPGKFCM